MTARRELDEFLEDLWARVSHGGSVTADEWKRAQALRMEAERERSTPGIALIPLRKLDLDRWKIRLGIDETAFDVPEIPPAEPPAPTRRGRPPSEIDTWYDDRLAEKLEIVRREGTTTAGPSLRSIWTRGNKLGHKLRWESFLDRWHALNGD